MTTLGVQMPIETRPEEVPTMKEFLALVSRVEILEQILIPKKQTGKAQIGMSPEGEAYVDLGWKPIQVSTDPPLAVELSPTGFSILGGIPNLWVSWTATG
jgi:hypothetical protein